MANIIHKQLSYKIIGMCFEVYNEIGGGYQEKYYQKALGLLFRKNKIHFKEQVKSDINFKNQNLGRYFLDFLYRR